MTVGGAAAANQLKKECPTCGRSYSLVKAAAGRTARRCLTCTALRLAWSSARARCHDPRNSNYPNYGARGIVMCPEWRASFAAFRRDMGEKPSPDLQLERVGNDEGYNKANCKWATRSEQQRNKRPRVLGETCRAGHPRTAEGNYVYGSTRCCKACIAAWRRRSRAEAATLDAAFTPMWSAW